MSRQSALLFAWGLSVALIIGCGGGDDTAQSPAPNPPAPPPAPPVTVEPGTPQDGSSAGAADNTNTVDNTNNTGGGTNTTTGTTAGLTAAPAKLAPYAKALSIVRPDHYAIVKFDLAGMRKSKLMTELPQDPDEMLERMPLPAEATGAGELLTKVDEVWISIGPPALGLSGPGAPPVQMGAYARFKSEEELNEATKEFGVGEMEEATHSGVTYFRPANAGAGPIYFTQGVELYLSTDEATIQQAIDAKGKLTDSDLVKNLVEADLSPHLLVAGSLGPMRDTVTMMLRDVVTQAPVPLAPTTAELPAQIDFGTIAISFDGETLIDIALDMDKPENAGVMKETLTGLISIGKIMLQQQGANLPDDPIEQQGFAITQKLVNAIKVEQADAHVDVTLPYIKELDDVPAMVSGMVEKQKQLYSTVNAPYLAIATLNYESAHGKLPANIKSADGEEVLSWRVAILPYLEETALYEQFDHQQAWDSEANAELSNTLVEVYETAGSTEKHLTTWKMLAGAPGDIMFIDAGSGTEVPWAKPDNFTIDQNLRVRHLRDIGA